MSKTLEELLEGSEPSPIEYFHSELMSEFHKYRKQKVGDKFDVEMTGRELTMLIAATKKKTYTKYAKMELDKPVPTEELE